MHLVFSKNRSLDSTYKGESELKPLGLMAERRRCATSSCSPLGNMDLLQLPF